mgnify:FL=1
MTQEDKQILVAAIQRYIKGEHPHSQYEVAQLQRIWRELHR